jgi:hypothetical protein
MDTAVENIGPSRAIGQDRSHAIQAREALLRQAWACVGENKSSGEIRSNLETLAARFPDEGRKALEVFDSLSKHVAALTTEREPEWLRRALQGKNTDEVTVQLIPTAIVVHLPEQLFSEICPGSNGRTISYDDLPKDLCGRIILMPHPPRKGADITLRHEIIHTLEDWNPPSNFVYGAVSKSVRAAAGPEQVLEQISLMGFFPRERARSEVVAYLGSGGPPRSLGVYGLKEAREEVQAVFQGLAMNANLSREEKTDLFVRATAKYQESILYAVALSVNFETLVRKVGPEHAIAQMLIDGDGELDTTLVSRRADELSTRFQKLLGQVKVDSSISEWMTKDWDALTQELLLCPHPACVPLVVEAIHRSVLPSQLKDFMEVLERAVEWNPESLDGVNMEKLRARLSDLATSPSCLFEYSAKSAEALLRRYENGSLFLRPFEGAVSHPLVRIGEALAPTAPASELIHLLCSVYPNRHPIWDSLPLGAIVDKRDLLERPDQIPLSIAAAEHASQEFDIVWSIVSLGDSARFGKLRESHLVDLRRILPKLPPVDKISFYSEKTRAMYREALTILSETATI